MKFALGKIHTSADLNIHFLSLYLPTCYLFNILKSLVMKMLQQFRWYFCCGHFFLKFFLLLWTFFFFFCFLYTQCVHFIAKHNESCFLFEPEGLYQGQPLKNICGLFLWNRKFQLLRQLGNAPGRKWMFSSQMCHSVLAEPGQFENYCLYIWN